PATGRYLRPGASQSGSPDRAVAAALIRNTIRGGLLRPGTKKTASLRTGGFFCALFCITEKPGFERPALDWFTPCRLTRRSSRPTPAATDQGSLPSASSHAGPLPARYRRHAPGILGQPVGLELLPPIPDVCYARALPASRYDKARCRCR